MYRTLTIVSLAATAFCFGVTCTLLALGQRHAVDLGDAAVQTVSALTVVSSLSTMLFARRATTRHER